MIVGRVEVNDVLRIVRVDLVDVLSKVAAWFGLDFLDLLESTGLHEGSLGLELEREALSELGADVAIRNLDLMVINFNK